MNKVLRGSSRRIADFDCTIRSKIDRVQAGAKPRVLDLFAGCGGMSLGFHAAGCKITAAVEFDAAAAKSHGLNFHSGDERHSKPRDIAKTSPESLAAELELGDVRDAFDIIIGGPPCQAFARVGRSKLREIAEHPEAFRHDPRSRLYIEYLHYVDKCRPLAVVMENVPDMLNFAGHNLADEIGDVLKPLGYETRYTLLNAAFYGVPQMRERMFLMAVHESVGCQILFPKPTHWVALPPGYDGSRAVALKLLPDGELVSTNQHYVPISKPAATLPAAVTARQALEDLPRIDARMLLAVGKLKRGTRRFTEEVRHQSKAAAGSYAALMRQWEGFTAESVKDHVIRYLPRDYPLFARLEAGDQYPEAHEHAKRMFDEALQKAESKAKSRIPKNTAEWKKLQKSIVPPYDPGKFPNKWRKMEPDCPARTLMAHLGKDSYSHIHYDSDQARTISVREAARLQSFPDGFVFAGTMNPAFKQIGNAVPPLLAKAVATILVQQLKARRDMEQPAAS